ncbi:MAG TPA: hypothetical protein GX701_06780 [Clostridiales bacterium]|jgi:uncharacterized membrane protein|nr:hypothetical protein [Clostridiales bacterium]
MLVLGIICIVGGLIGYFYTLHEMKSLEHAFHIVGDYLGVTDTPTLDILNKVSIIVIVLGVIFLIIGIVKMAKN